VWFSLSLLCLQIDEVVHNETVKRNAYPSPLNYYHFPKSCCTSVNEVCVCVCMCVCVCIDRWLHVNNNAKTLTLHLTHTHTCMHAQVICHGVPDMRPLEDGDIVNIDISVFYKGFHGDLNETFCVGTVDQKYKVCVCVCVCVCVHVCVCVNSY
jgi:methionyl aminopeptidase